MYNVKNQKFLKHLNIAFGNVCVWEIKSPFLLPQSVFLFKSYLCDDNIKMDFNNNHIGHHIYYFAVNWDWNLIGGQMICSDQGK